MLLDRVQRLDHPRSGVRSSTAAPKQQKARPEGDNDGKNHQANRTRTRTAHHRVRIGNFGEPLYRVTGFSGRVGEAATASCPLRAAFGGFRG